MKTTLLIKQHQKCLEILEAIEKADKRIYGIKKDLSTVGSWLYSTDLYKQRLDANKAIRSRLINYYANTFTKMCQNVTV